MGRHRRARTDLRLLRFERKAVLLRAIVKPQLRRTRYLGRFLAGRLRHQDPGIPLKIILTDGFGAYKCKPSAISI